MTDVAKGDVVQLDPTSELGKMYGAQFVVVTDLKAWGFQGYFLHVNGRADFGPAYLRVNTGDFVPIGRAEWCLESSP